MEWFLEVAVKYLFVEYLAVHQIMLHRRVHI